MSDLEDIMNTAFGAARARVEPCGREVNLSEGCYCVTPD